MNEPWFNPGIIGGIIGSTLGLFGAITGTVGGVFVQKGKSQETCFRISAIHDCPIACPICDRYRCVSSRSTSWRMVRIRLLRPPRHSHFQYNFCGVSSRDIGMPS